VRINQTAWTPRDKTNAQQLLLSITDYEEQSRQAAERARRLEETQAMAATAVVVPSTATKSALAEPKNIEEVRTQPKEKRTQYMAEGVIADAECNGNSTGRVTLTVNHSQMKFIYSSLAKLTVVEGLTEDSGKAPACTEWKGKRARLFFYPTEDKPYAGDLRTVQFF